MAYELSEPSGSNAASPEHSAAGGYRQFTIDYDPIEDGGISQWFCVDDRPPLDGGMYRQIGGGAIGAGYDTLVAAELGYKGIILKQEYGGSYSQDSASRAQIHVVGNEVAMRARSRNVTLGLHEDCKAEDAAIPIAGTIINPDNRDQLFGTARIFYPELEEATFEDIVTINEGILAQRAIASATEARIAMKNAGIRRIALLPIPHKAENFLVDHRRSVAFDVAKAMGDPEQPTSPGYHASVGDFDEITGPASAVIESDVTSFHEHFLAASAVRHAAIVANLPTPSGNPLGVIPIAKPVA